MSVVVLSESRPVARKEHLCGNCELPIEPGTQYVRQNNVYDGHVYTWKSHEDCHSLFCHLWNVWWMEDGDSIPPDEFRTLIEDYRAGKVLEPS